MARQAQHCPIPHDVANNRPRLGVSLLSPSPNPRPILDLLGVSDQALQEQMAKGHPYIFNMGGGKFFKNYRETVNALMERNMPDILHDKQTEIFFLPEAHMPKMARIVDIKRFEVLVSKNIALFPPCLNRIFQLHFKTTRIDWLTAYLL